ncbi:MAG: heavy metal translocating P-type ATPase, partial [Bacilli bacterium]|nr:heavy metal translocating P-type ATPase [Bacilli bacterium]
DDLMKISEGIDISKYTNYIIKQNLIFAIGVKVIILLLSVVGIASMWFAVFADTGVTLLTVLNTIRIRNKFK